MPASKNQNPRHNSVLQALIDLQNAGCGTLTIDQAVTKLRSDRKLADNLQAKWDSHLYPNHAITWTQLTKAQQLMTLSDAALKILNFLGMYAHQSGLLQVRYQDLSAATGIKMTTMRAAIQELTSCGCINIMRKAVRHAAPIYEINPALFQKGRRSTAGPKGSPISKDYILRRELPLIVHEQNVSEEAPDGSRIAYTRLSLQSPEEAAAAEKPKRRRKADPDAIEQLPGQMEFGDFPGVVPNE